MRPGRRRAGQHGMTCRTGTVLFVPAEHTTSPDDASLRAQSSPVHGLYADGIIGVKRAFSPSWADAMREDIEVAFREAIRRPGGAVGRGPQRWYVEIHPQVLRGFVDLVSHPWVTEVCEGVLGP